MDEIRRRADARPVGDGGRSVAEVEAVPTDAVMREHDVDAVRRAMRCVRAEETIVGSRVPFDVAGDTVEDDLARRDRDLGVCVSVRVVVPEGRHGGGGIEGDALRVVDVGARERRRAGSVADVLPVDVDDVSRVHHDRVGLR